MENTIKFTPQNSLEGQFLVSMPQLYDPNFFQSVILICRHDENGAMGVVINRPTKYSLGDIFQQLSIDISSNQHTEQRVLEGGPVSPELGLIIHEPAEFDWQSSLQVGENLILTSSKDILIALAKGNGSKNIIMSLGYAGWSAGQLEQEIKDNAWFSTPADHTILFSENQGSKWKQAALILGIDPNQLSGVAGHA